MLAEAVGGGPALPNMRRRRHDDDVLHLGATKNAPKCVSQQRLTAQRGERFGHPGTQTHTTTGSNQDDRDS
jgi:hypothetical protein